MLGIEEEVVYYTGFNLSYVKKSSHRLGSDWWRCSYEGDRYLISIDRGIERSNHGDILLKTTEDPKNVLLSLGRSGPNTLVEFLRRCKLLNRETPPYFRENVPCPI